MVGRPSVAPTVDQYDADHKQCRRRQVLGFVALIVAFEAAGLHNYWLFGSGIGTEVVVAAGVDLGAEAEAEVVVVVVVVAAVANLRKQSLE